MLALNKRIRKKFIFKESNFHKSRSYLGTSLSLESVDTVTPYRENSLTKRSQSAGTREFRHLTIYVNESSIYKGTSDAVRANLAGDYPWIDFLVAPGVGSVRLRSP